MGQRGGNVYSPHRVQRRLLLHHPRALLANFPVRLGAELAPLGAQLVLGLLLLTRKQQLLLRPRRLLLLPVQLPPSWSGTSCVLKAKAWKQDIT